MDSQAVNRKPDAAVNTQMRVPGIAIISLILVTLSVVIAARTGLIENDSLGPNASLNVNQGNGVYEHRMLNFFDLKNGSVEVVDHQHGTPIVVLASGEGSFVRGVLRSLTRERRARGHGQEEPFELRAEADNKLLLIDSVTGTTLLLNAFGPSNAAAFAEFLHAPTSKDT